MEKYNEIIAQLKACANTVAGISNTTEYKGCLIDAEAHIQNAIVHIERHARNEEARCGQ